MQTFFGFVSKCGAKDKLQTRGRYTRPLIATSTYHHPLCCFQDEGPAKNGTLPVLLRTNNTRIYFYCLVFVGPNAGTTHTADTFDYSCRCLSVGETDYE